MGRPALAKPACLSCGKPVKRRDGRYCSRLCSGTAPVIKPEPEPEPEPELIPQEFAWTGLGAVIRVGFTFEQVQRLIAIRKQHREDVEAA